ncbi:MAG: two-component sensor histidine kinase, partial [Beijerinckiaceae bacterium]
MNAARLLIHAVGSLYNRIAVWLKRVLPKGLYARSLLIIIVPMVLLQSVVAYVFMERHYQLVTRRLSQGLTQDIAALIDLYRDAPGVERAALVARVAEQRLQLDVDFLPLAPLPPAGPKPFFDILDPTLSEEFSRQIRRPFWLDTVGRSSLIEIRIQLDDSLMRVIARRSQAYASNSEIFLLWMVGTSLVLL